jgi:hypothetical protein
MSFEGPIYGFRAKPSYRLHFVLFFLHNCCNAEGLCLDLFGFRPFEKKIDAGIEVTEPNLEEFRSKAFFGAHVEMKLRQVAGVTTGSENGLRPERYEDGQVFLEVDFDYVRKDVSDGRIAQQPLVKGIDELVEVVLVFDVFHKKRSPFLGTLKLLNVEFFKVEGNGFFLFVVLHQQHVAHFPRKHFEFFRFRI